MTWGGKVEEKDPGTPVYYITKTAFGFMTEAVTEV